jgi:hypothetical protein
MLQVSAHSSIPVVHADGGVNVVVRGPMMVRDQVKVALEEGRAAEVEDGKAEDES